MKMELSDTLIKIIYELDYNRKGWLDLYATACMFICKPYSYMLNFVT
jgi:hypothetical protein